MSLPPIEGTPDLEGADCVACGRCCHHAPSSVSLLEDDEARLDAPTLRRLTVLLDRPPYLRFLRTEDGHCAALDTGTPDRHACSIYVARPTGCRTLEPDSPACREARRLGYLGASVEYRAATRR